MTAQAILFDLDGTLLDTLEDLADSMNAVLEEKGFASHPLEFYKTAVGDGVKCLIQRSLPSAVQDDDKLVAQCGVDMREVYSRRWDIKTRPYDGVPEMLTALTGRGVRMSILSNKPDPFTVQIVKALLPDWTFDIVQGARDGVPRKPDPASALDIAARLDIEPTRWLYLGDTNTDMQTATAAGMFPLGALWGFRTAEELTANGARALMAHPRNVLDHV